MECREARDHLAELTRAHLAPDLADAVRAHAAGCATCADALRAEAVLHTVIREQAPHYTAPPALRARVEVAFQEAGRPVSFGWRAWLVFHPWTARGLAGALASLIVIWTGTTWLAQDPVSRLVSRAVDEHREYARDAMQRPAPNPVELLAMLRPRTSFPLGSLFPGDTEALLIATTTVELRGKPAVALVYRNGPERYTTLLLMPGADVTIPAEDRRPIETFKPHHRVASGKQVLYWKQNDLACMMVSDLDESAMATLFLKIRKAA